MPWADPIRRALLDSLTVDVGKTLVGDPCRQWTVGQILGAAAALRPRIGCGEGPIGVACTDSGWVLASLVGAWSVGRRPVLLDPTLRRELASLDRAYPGIPVFADHGKPQPGRILTAELAPERTPATPPPWLVIPGDDEPFAGFLTSGSEGENKVVDKQGGQFYRQGAVFGEVLGLPARCRVLSLVPPYHMLGFQYGLFLPLVLGGETIVATGLTGAAMVQLIGRHQPDLVIGTATHYRYLVRDPASARAEALPSTVFLSSGAPLDPVVAEAFAARYGTQVHETYGSTELAGVAWRRWPDPYRTWPGVAFRIDPDTSRLEVHSPWGGGAPDAWIATDDAAEPAGDGCFRLLGRLSHMVKVGAKRFSSVEVEQTLRTMPGVAEVVVVPYDRYGQQAIAAIISLEPEVTPDADRVRGFLASRLAAFKLPRTIRFLAELPRGSLGKVDYAALRALATSGEPDA
jgi:acyl-coenzyme A synthetase/AMP-(fatty) acid ligase